MKARLLSRRSAIAAIGLAALTGVLLDLFAAGVGEWFSDHQFVTALLAESLLLAGVYVGVEYVLSRSEARRWRKAAEEPLRHIQNSASQLDNILDDLISEDRKSIDLNADGVKAAQIMHARLKNYVDRYQALLTASPYMVQFLPSAIELERYASYVLSPALAGARLTVEWYDEAVRTFATKFAEVINLGEYDEKWLLLVPREAYERQLRERVDPDDQEFLKHWLKVWDQAHEGKS